MRPKITLSSTKMTVWYTECRCSRVCAVVIWDRRAPITRPATITAVTPETWNVSPSRYAAYGVTRAATVSSTGSVIRRRTTMTPAATTAPTSTPPPASTTNLPTPCSRMPVAAIPAVPPTARETAIWYSTRLVPSLNKLSACTSVCTLTGSESRRASALTATGSVLARTAPRTSAVLADKDATATPTAATAAAEASTSPTASTATGRHTARRSRQASSSLAAYSSGGSTTRLTTSGGTSDRGRPRQHAHGQADHHQQGRSGNPQPPGEGRHHGSQRDQQHHGLNNAHAGPPLRSDGRSRPDFPALRKTPASRRPGFRTAGHRPAIPSSYVFFCRTGLGMRSGYVPVDLRVRGGRMYGEGWEHEEIRVAIDGSSGAYDDDPEQAGDSKPEKRRAQSGQDVTSPVNTQPAEIRSRTEYYEELRPTDKQMAAADGYSNRSALDSLHVAPERAKHILDGDRWGGGHRHGTGRPGKTEFPSGWDDEKILGHVLAVAQLQTTRPYSRPTADGGCMATVTRSVLPSSSSPMAGSGQPGPTPTAQVWSRTRGRRSERIRGHRAH